MNDPINITLEPQLQHEIQPGRRCPLVMLSTATWAATSQPCAQQNSELPGRD